MTFTVHLLTRQDLSRQLVKSNYCTISLPDYQLTIPPGRGQLSNVEGVLRDTIRDLGMDQVLRRAMDPENAAKIDALLASLRELLGIDEDDEELAVDSEKPFKPTSITLDDPSGNSFFQFIGSASDPQWNMRAYNRTLDQNVTLGLVARADDAPEQQHAGQTVVADDHKLKSAAEFEAMRATQGKNLKDTLDGIVPDEVFSFPSTCSSCGHELETLMKQVNIPYFQVSRLLLFHATLKLTIRTSSSWRQIALLAATGITKLNPVEQFPTRVKRLLSKWRTRRISAVTCSR